MYYVDVLKFYLTEWNYQTVDTKCSVVDVFMKKTKLISENIQINL